MNGKSSGMNGCGGRSGVTLGTFFGEGDAAAVAAQQPASVRLEDSSGLDSVQLLI
jgi:hypothetical protein